MTRRIRIQDIDLAYEEVGEGRPILLLHGFKPDRRLMKGAFEPIFSKRPGWRRIYLDLPGMGESGVGPAAATSDGMLRVVLGFIDGVLAGSRFTLAGQSFGGALARGIVKDRGNLVDGLCLLCPATVEDPTKRNLPARQIVAPNFALRESLSPQEREEFGGIAVAESPRIWERTRDEIFVGVHAAQHGFLDALTERGAAFSQNIDTLDKPFEKPGLFLMGRQDHRTGYRDVWPLLEHYPRTTFAVLDRAGHHLHIEQEALFNALAGEWLDRVDEATPK